MAKLLEETKVVLIVGAPALLASLGVILLLKATCGLLWNSSCQVRMVGVHHLDEPIQIARTHVPPELITPVVLGTYRGP